MKLFHSDVMAVSFCNRGAREFCVKHGIDWGDFVRNGIEVSKVTHIDDAMLKRAITAAEARENRLKGEPQ